MNTRTMVQESGKVVENPKRDLRRYAACLTSTGEVLEVGMNKTECDSYVSSFNQSMGGKDSCKAVPVEFKFLSEN